MAVKKFSTPGVYRSEIDLSESVAPAGTSTGAIVIRSVKGPINRPVLVASEKELFETFGKPVFTSGAGTVGSLQADIRAGIPNNGYGTYAAIEFLKESNSLYVSRAVDASDKFSSVSIKSTYDYTATAGASSYLSATTTSGITCVPYVPGNQFDRLDNNTSIEAAGVANLYNVLISSLYPGDEGNNIAVTMETYSSGCDWVYKYDGISTSGLSATTSVTQTIAAKVVRIDVYVKETTQSWASIQYDIQTRSTASGTSATYSGLRDIISPVETFYCSLTPTIDSEGRQLQAAYVINGNSKYIYVKTATTALDPITTVTSPIVKWYSLLPLNGGVVNSNATGLGDSDTTAVLAAWSIYQSREFIPNINLLCNCDWNTTIKQRVAQIAATRMDCLAFGQTGDPSKTSVADIIASEAYGYTNPSYMALYAGYDKIYDANNDKYFYLPKSVFGPVICARTDAVSNTWEAPAGQARGIIPSIGQRITFTNAQIGQLYDRNINTSTTQPGLGSYILGQKTAQLKQSSLSRINNRRNLLFLENSIEPLLNAFLFELNNERTRQRITANVDSFLSDVQAAGGLDGKQVICDLSNNTVDIINNNQLVVDVYVQLPQVIEFIQFRTIISKTGVAFARV